MVHSDPSHSLFAAVSRLSLAFSMLGKEFRNNHGKYNYITILDIFLFSLKVSACLPDQF